MAPVEFKKAKTYLVRGADGTRMPLVPVRVGGVERPIVADGGLVPAVFTPETVIRVIDCPFTRRQIRSGSFVEVKEPPPAAADLATKKVKKED